MNVLVWLARPNWGTGGWLKFTPPKLFHGLSLKGYAMITPYQFLCGPSWQNQTDASQSPGHSILACERSVQLASESPAYDALPPSVALHPYPPPATAMPALPQ